MKSKYVNNVKNIIKIYIPVIAKCVIINISQF